ncbi:hypothetical protein [Asticcacaulis benevestitus]|uniref:Uncharacterized protein n=1 Tax=Asticcacaulis benevestitus DSM 16100 = ATCC BAA-896 TaxID=1121022 RepID=V4P9K0_9CAUL|nr:hypothetical protein [Asticcacaulis benevestitus]ESQ83764.1 hypothetical protein ABENE_20035 [Asticcacaulis benevestitus DSM 16100 = ATCC BAA-896]
MSKFLRHSLAFAGAIGLALMATTSAQAGARDRVVSVQGVHGHGYLAGRKLSRNPGETQVRRSLQTQSGHGVATTRDTTYGDGVVSSSASRIYNNGATASRSGSVVVGEGTVSGQRTRTGVAGNTQSAWDTVYRTDDGYGRTRGVETSSGRSVTAERDVSVTDGSVVVGTQVTTGAGGTASRVRTFDRNQ